MSNIEIYKKPQLIILEEQPKLRTMQIESRLTVAKLLVSNLLNDLGVGKNSDTNHHIRTIKFIAESMINYSAGEIEKAFQMFIAGDFREKPYQQLNSVIVGKVMGEYENHKRDKLKVYRQKETLKNQQMKKPTKAEEERIMLDAVDRVKKEVKEFGHIKGSAHHVYDFLVESGRVEFSKKERWAAHSIAKRMLIADEKNKAIGDYLLTKKLKKTLLQIEGGFNSRQVVIAKTLLIENLYKNDK